MSQNLAMMVAAGTVVGLAGAVRAQVIDWNNAGGGSWHTAANWLPANEPDTAGESARFSLAGVYAVEVTAPRTISDLLILNNGTSVRLNGGASMTASSVANFGLLTINANGSGTGTALTLLSGAAVTGSGSIFLNATQGVLDRAYIQPNTSGGFWTNGAGHTVRGRGHLYYGIHNDGTLRADQPGEILETTQGTILNSGVIESTTGIFQFNGGTIDQTSGGTIRANAVGADVRFIGGASVIGGTVSATGGLAAVTSATSTFNGAAVSGTFNINNGCGLSAVNGLTQHGVLTVNAQGGGTGTALTVAAGTTLGGSGTVVLNATQGVLDRAQLYPPSQLAWTHGAGHTVSGRGNIYYSLVNNGTITANAPGEVLQMTQGTVTNNATLQATGGGILQLLSETVNQAPGASVLAAGGDVRLVSSNITGGTVSASAGNSVSSTSGGQTLTGLTSTGAFNIDNGTTVLLNGVVTQTGTMTVNTQGGGTGTALLVTAGATLAGPGTVVLNATQNVLDRAVMYSPSHAAWTHGAGHTVRGRGNMYYDFVNDGTITADRPAETLQLLSGTVTNRGTIQALGGGVLQLNSATVSQTAPGVVAATSGPVRMVSSTISGGTITSNASNHIIGAQGTQTLTGGVVLNGPFDVNNGTTLATPAGLTHTGTILVNTEGGGSVTAMLVTAGTALSGSGTVVLNATQGVADRAQLYSPSHLAWTHSAGHTVRGRGIIYYDLINNGSIIADQTGEALQMTQGVVTNNSLLTAVSGATLQLNSETVNQGAGGSVSAAGGTVSLNASTISGGAVSSTAGGRVVAVAGTQTLTGGVSVSGVFDLNNGVSLSLPTGLTNHGTLTVNTQGGGSATPVTLGSGGVLGGTGTLVLNATQGVFDRAYVYAPTGTITNGPGHTIAGTGNVYAAWTNRGTVRPSGPSRRIDCQQGAFTQAPDGTFEVEVSGLAAGQYGRLAGPQAKVLGGTLKVTLVDGFVPHPCDLLTIITGPITGSFAAYDFPTLPLGGFHAIYSGNSVVLSYIPADFNGDGFPDFFDYDDFVGAFERGDPEADFNHDGFLDFFDYDAFIEAFESGC